MNGTAEAPGKRLSELVRSGNQEELSSFVGTLAPLEMVRSLSRLSSDDQSRLFSMLDPNEAVELVSSIPEPAALQLVEGLPATQAGPIVEGLPSDRDADLLGQMKEEDASAILETLPLEKSEEIRLLMTYPPDSAGGLMIPRFVSYPEHFSVRDTLEDMRVNGDAYSDYAIQYAYVVSSDAKDAGRLLGVLRLRDLPMAPRDKRVTEVMIANPLRVGVNERLVVLRNLFDQHGFLGLPVVDDEENLVGVVSRTPVEQQINKQANESFLKVSGIVGGEEFRTMSLMKRSSRRLSWLSLNVVLNIIAASVIMFYQDTLAQVIALAVFLPIISDMSGCSGNQAVAVSIRELTLGMIRPRELLRVIFKEATVGIVNGMVLGLLVGGTAILWKGNPFLGLVVGLAMAVNTIVSVCLGGAVPLILKSRKIDPALASGPILTTVTDMCGFFLVLSLATLLLEHLR